MASEKRGSWSSHAEFILTSLGLVVGLGNVWRFPYVTYANGGGSFLLPYALMLALVGWPLLFQDMALGQFSGVGINRVYAQMVPAFKGLAHATLVVRVLALLFFGAIESWVIFYIFAGFNSDLPWTSCEEEWNTKDCFIAELSNDCEPGSIYFNFTCSSFMEYCTYHGYEVFDASSGNCVDAYGYAVPLTDVLASNAISPAEDYFNGRVLGLTKNADGERYTWEDYGPVQWELVLCLLLSWILTGLFTLKGVRSLGKVAYVLTSMPYVVLTVLLIYSATLDGAADGIDFYLSADWSTLSELSLWVDAATQVISSLALGTGTHIALSSFNPRHNSVHLDAAFVAGMNSLTSLYAGFAVFLMLGFLSADSGLPVESVVQGGAALAFVVVPAAVAEMAAPQLWSFLFFFMLFNLALSSMAGNFVALTSFVLDEWPWLRKYDVLVTLACASALFICGLPFTCGGGIHLFTLLDGRGFPGLMSVAFVQCIAVAWVYGMSDFTKDLRSMSVPLPRWASLSICALYSAVIPAVVATLFVYELTRAENIGFGGYEYPQSLQIVGWLVMVLPISVFVGYLAYFVIAMKTTGVTWREVLRQCVRAKPEWFALRDDKVDPISANDISHTKEINCLHD